MVVNFFSDFCFPGGIPVHQGELALILNKKYGCDVKICVPWPLRYDMEEHKESIYKHLENKELEKLYSALIYLCPIKDMDQLRSVIRSADVNHFHGSFSTERKFLGEAIDATEDSRKNFYTFHSEAVNPECESDNSELLRRLDKMQTICAVSSGVKNAVEKVAANRKIIITPNGYSLSQRFSKQDKRQFTILYIGRLNKTKGIENVIRLAKEIRNTDIKFIIVGASEFDIRYDQLLDEISAHKNIEWISETLSKTALLSLYNISDVFYFPSQMEGSPLVVLDAIANGCIPVVSHAGSLDEIITQEENGFIYDWDDFESQFNSIMKLYTNKELFSRMKNNVRKTKLKTWEGTADILYQLYKKVNNG